MSLSPDHLPLPCSLRDRVNARFARQEAPTDENALSQDDLVRYLAERRPEDPTPRATIERRAGEEGRSATLYPSDEATLGWVTASFDHWQERYPLESPLRDHVRRLLPLAAAVALRDEGFFTVGAHPLHRLLDSLQSGAVGWQVRLDRAGQMLEQRVERSVEKALEWFAQGAHDIGAIQRELDAANERDAARAQRMVQRLAETEEARLRTLSAKREAAQSFNDLLQDYQLPSAIGEFLKGPWYDSAQLVLVKHGAESEDWKDMLRATRHLMESVQPTEDADEVSRDRRAQILRHLPAELRRWLVSLEHDSEATDSAVGLVEYAHLRIQHGQVLELSQIAPLPVEAAESHEDNQSPPLETGQWYRFSDEDGELRAQLALQLDEGRQLLFTNFVGLKALDLPGPAFRQRLRDEFARLLPCRATFSLSLAATAGIDSEEALRALIDPNYRPEQPEETHPAPDASTPAAESTPQYSDSDGPASEGPAADTVAPVSAEHQDQDTAQAAPAAPGEMPAASTGDASHDVSPAPAEGTGEFGNAGAAPAAGPAEYGSTSPAPGEGRVDTASEESWTQQPGATSPPGREFASDQPQQDPQAVGAGQATPMQEPAPHTPAAAAPEASRDVGFRTPAETSPMTGTPAEPTAAGETAPTAGPGEYGAQEHYSDSNQPGTGTPQAPSPDTPGQGYAHEQPPPPPAQAPPPPPPPPDQQPPYPGQAATSTQAPPPQPSTWRQPSQQPPEPQQPWPQPDAPGSPPGQAPPPPPGSQPPPGYGQQPPPQQPWTQATAQPPVYPPPASPPEREIEVPMGAWIGFHDGETPIMAKLAVYDPRRDNYIFVNRKGICLRELNRAELVALIDQGLVDILETRSYFRDEVQRARGEES